MKPRVTVAHLFGEPAGNRRVEGELSLTPALPRFARYPDHRFQIGEALNEPYHETLAATVTDDKGDARVHARPEALRRPRLPAEPPRRAPSRRKADGTSPRRTARSCRARRYLVGVKTDGDLSVRRRAAARAQAHWLAVEPAARIRSRPTS